MTKIERILNEMKEHVKWTGATVYSSDDSQTRTIGWCTKDPPKRWDISVFQLNRDLNSMLSRGDTRVGTLRKCATTSAGRLSLATSVPGQNMTSRPPTFECRVCLCKTWLPHYRADLHTPEECETMLVRAVMES